MPAEPNRLRLPEIVGLILMAALVAFVIFAPAEQDKPRKGVPLKERTVQPAPLKLWVPPDSWEPGDGVPPGHKMDPDWQSKWRQKTY